MIKCIPYCVSILVLVIAGAAACAAEQATKNKPVLRAAASLPSLAKDDCETRIRGLDASEAEGEERLTEKREAIDHCVSQYKHDKTIERLVKDCAKYEEQPVVKQQLVAECQLAAFNYANALRMLKAEYRK
jgi:hypothetical protein